jgi:hypothetical protein
MTSFALLGKVPLAKYINLNYNKVYEANIKKGLHKDERVAIKEVDLDELGDKNLDNLSVMS